MKSKYIDFKETEFKYPPGTKVLFRHQDKMDVFYVYKYHRFFDKDGAYFDRYIIRRLYDDHQVSMVKEGGFKALFEIREKKLGSILDE
jgi:hypothetical protein